MTKRIFKTFVAIAIALLSGVSLNAQNTNDNTIYSQNEVDIVAEYQGGKAAIRAFLEANTVIPQEVIDAEAYCIVYVNYVVEKDGSISNITIENPSNDYYVKLCEEAAKTVVGKLANFTPAKINNQAVRSKNKVPVAFSLR